MTKLFIGNVLITLRFKNKKKKLSGDKKINVYWSPDCIASHFFVSFKETSRACAERFFSCLLVIKRR